MKRLLLCAWLLTFLLSPSAHADSAAAKPLFEQGAKAYQEGRYERAVELFLQAYDADPHPALMYNVGQAYEKAGDVPNALRSYRRYLRADPQASDRDTVTARIRSLEQRLRERGVQQVTISSSPSGANLAVDGKAVGETPWTGELAPGKHVVVLRAPGHTDTRKEFLLTEDRSLDLDVALQPPVLSAAAAPATERPDDASPAVQPSPQRDRASQHGVEPWTWATLGVGAVGLGAALGFELSRQSAEDDARNAPTQLEHQDHFQTMESRRNTARVLLGVGLAASAVGATLLVLDLSRDDERRVGVAVGAQAGGGHAALRGQF